MSKVRIIHRNPGKKVVDAVEVDENKLFSPKNRVPIAIKRMVLKALGTNGQIIIRPVGKDTTNLDERLVFVMRERDFNITGLIKAIKMHREETMSTLKVSKAYCEQLRTKHDQ